MKNRFTITENEKKRILGLHEQMNNPLANANPLSNLTLRTGGNPLNVGNKLPQFQVDPKVQELINTANKFVAENPKLPTLAIPDIENYLNYAFKDNPAIIPYVKVAITSMNPTIKFPDASQQNQVGQVSAATPSQEVKAENIQPGVFNQKVLDLQKKLNEKYKAGLTEDGKWGPKTSLAVANALKNVPSAITPANPLGGSTNVGGIVGAIPGIVPGAK